jgi:hypothetical protein
MVTMPAKPTDDPIIRKTVGLPASVWAQVQAFQEALHIKYDADAVRRLVTAGLEVYAAHHKPKRAGSADRRPQDVPISALGQR